MAQVGKHYGLEGGSPFPKIKKRVCFIDLRTFVETPT